MASKNQQHQDKIQFPNLAQFRALASWSQDDLARKAGVKRSHISNIENGQGISYVIAEVIQKTLNRRLENLGVTKELTIAHLRGMDVNYEFEKICLQTVDRAQNLKEPDPNLPDWSLGNPGPWRTASNGLHWCVYTLNHKHARGKKARGKLYDLRRSLPTRSKREMESCLDRHREVCDRIGRHPHVVRNITSLPVKPHFWWVIDEWIEGQPLDYVLQRGVIPAERLPAIMYEILLGLQALHAADVIRRELSPRYVFINDRETVLTDFELAKLLDGSPTVSPIEMWPDDVYRAPEVGEGDLHPSCDVFSWAMILAHAVSGHKPTDHNDAASAVSEGLPKQPKNLRSLAHDCLGPYTDRPDIGMLIRECYKWRRRFEDSSWLDKLSAVLYR